MRIGVAIIEASDPRELTSSGTRPMTRWECEPGALPAVGDLVRGRDDQPPYQVVHRVWIDPQSLALLVAKTEQAPAIINVLDLSTGHLPRAICEGLNGFDGVIAHAYPHGVWLWVPEDPAGHASSYGDPAECDGVPAEVIVIQTYARAAGCDWVRLDADGTRNPDLPYWEWEW